MTDKTFPAEDIWEIREAFRTLFRKLLSAGVLDREELLTELYRE